MTSRIAPQVCVSLDGEMIADYALNASILEVSNIELLFTINIPRGERNRETCALLNLLDKAFIANGPATISVLGREFFGRLRHLMRGPSFISQCWHIEAYLLLLPQIGSTLPGSSIVALPPPLPPAATPPPAPPPASIALNRST
jgi:hypothetical protein